MTYSTGNIIEAVDYNNFGNSVNQIWGVGADTFGYGQVATLANVAVNAEVTATNWASLNTRIASIANHTNTTITSRTGPVTNDIISTQTNLATDVTNITNNRGNARQRNATTAFFTGSCSKTTATGSGNTAWTISWFHTVDFVSADRARYFFNAGGAIQLEMSKLSTGTDSDPDWNTFIANMGTFYITGGGVLRPQTVAGISYPGFLRIGGSGSPTIYTTNTGWYDLPVSASSTTVFQLFNNAVPYTSNFVNIWLQKNSTSVMTVIVQWSAAATSTPGATTNISGGTATSSPGNSFGTAPATICKIAPPWSGAFLNPVPSPTVSCSIVSTG